VTGPGQPTFDVLGAVQLAVQLPGAATGSSPTPGRRASSAGDRLAALLSRVRAQRSTVTSTFADGHGPDPVVGAVTRFAGGDVAGAAPPVERSSSR
jgi:hypothetical protein